MSRVKCLACNTILWSKTRHDFQQCDCTNQTFVDGGDDYIRAGGMDMNLVQVLPDWKIIDKDIQIPKTVDEELKKKGVRRKDGENG